MSNNIDMLTLAPEIDRLHQECLSLIMATTNAAHVPCASYTPFAYMDSRFYILVSALATHGQNLKTQSDLDILLIEDESRARNIYARLRVNYQVIASPVEKGSAEHDRAVTLLGQRAGKTVALLDSLDDFTMYRLTPVRATLVQGFGKAFVFDPMNQFEGAVALSEKNIDQYR